MDINKVAVIEYFTKRQEIWDSLKFNQKDIGNGCINVPCEKCPYGTKKRCRLTETMSIGDCLDILQITMDYEIPIDWGNVPVDTKILVRQYFGDKWEKRHFAKCVDGEVYAWQNGKTSFTADDLSDCIAAWKFAKLYNEEADEL